MIKINRRNLKRLVRRLARRLKASKIGQIKHLRKKAVLAACSVLIAVTGIGMASIPHEEKPVPQELLEEAMAVEEEQPAEEEPEVLKVCEEGCTLEEGHDGECVLKKEDITVVLKSTSMERDLKVKFVDEATGKVITGEKFQMKLTDSAKKSKEYSDTDGDGIIWVKDIDGGSYTVAMLDLEGYVTAKTLSAEVKKKIEYKVVEVAEEVKSESEIIVSQEDAEFSGAAADESTSNSTVLKDTVEYVASKTEGVQKKDEFGQLVYAEFQYKNGAKMYAVQKTDDFGTPMYEKIISEPDKYHVYKDGVCERCGAKEQKADCTHKDDNNDNICDICGTEVSGIHQHVFGEGSCVCTLCSQTVHGALENGICSKCESLVKEEEHVSCTPDDSGKCKYCGKTVDQETTENSAEGMQVSVRNQFRMTAFGMAFRSFELLKAAEPEKIVYDTSSKPIYDTTSAPVYDTKSAPVYEKTVYYGWQTIDGATYYFDKNGNKVTGQQVIQGVAYTFSSDGVRSGTIGIDVSKYQKNINWTKIKNAGINFVMIRCGYRGYGSGVLVEDPMYASHITGAKAAGLRVGVYFFSQAVNEAEAVEEASMAVSLAKKYGINMPIAIDSEYANAGNGRADKLSKSERTAVTKAFCNTVKNAGYTPMVYASKSWFGSKLDVSQLSAYKIWVAHYAETCGYTGTYHIWQNTSKGKVDGYSGYLDMNISKI